MTGQPEDDSKTAIRKVDGGNLHEVGNSSVAWWGEFEQEHESYEKGFDFAAVGKEIDKLATIQAAIVPNSSQPTTNIILQQAKIEQKKIVWWKKRQKR